MKSVKVLCCSSKVQLKIRRRIVGAAFFAVSTLPGLTTTQLAGEPNTQRGPNYTIVDERYGFELIWRQRQSNSWAQEVLIETSQGEDRPPSGPWTFNWAVRRNPYFLVSGDQPRFALARTFPTRVLLPPKPADLLNPPIAKLGDLRIRVTADGRSYWLDEIDKIKARFYPWGTLHHGSLRPDVPLDFDVLATMVENRGMAVQINVNGDSARPLKIKLELVYGGLDFKDPQVPVPYFGVDPNEQRDDNITLKESGGTLSDPKIPVQISVISDPRGGVEVQTPTPGGGNETHNHLVFRHQFIANQTKHTFRLLVFQSDASKSQDLRIERFDEYVRQTQEYYAKLLEPLEIHTPDKVLNAGFYAAAVNLDYTYQPPAWLEGIHKWNSYIVNNYQISAAVLLGQLERARHALLFFADRPGGPGQSLNADGSVFDDIVNLKFEGGLHYYILQLYQYWLATGDTDTLDRVWKPTTENLERMMKLRDPEGNLLLNWHRGANMFLYQADHLSLPGDAFSPTIMTADSLEKMAEMGEARGEYTRATAWRRRAAYMRSEVVRRLWLPREGKFAAAIDTQGLVLQANYYTDFVFPQLYSKLPAEYSWISLKTLDRTLWVGDDLMRVGNYLPPLFGNNNVMPVQMAEAAEAYFQAGRANEGARLLHGTARGATTHTDSPGSFPERMSDTGHGQPDYLFGNPAGAYVRAVVSGLFGLVRVTPTRPLLWRPSIPGNWDSASLRLGDISMSITGRHGDRRYSLTLEKPQSLHAYVPLWGDRVERVLNATGHPAPFQVIAHPGGGFLQIRFEPATRHEFQVTTKAVRINWEIPRQVKPKLEITWPLPSPGISVSDPQGVFDKFRIEGSLLTGHLGHSEGPKTFFLWDRKNNAVVPVDLHFDSPPEKSRGPLVLSGKREHLTLDARFNSDSIMTRNFWRHAPVKIELANHVTLRGTKGLLKVGEYVFQVQPTGKNMILLDVGEEHPYTHELSLSNEPGTVTTVEQPYILPGGDDWLAASHPNVILGVGKKVRGIEFLVAAEMDVRLTGLEVGSIQLRYVDGAIQKEALIVGRNVDCLTKPFATDVASCKLSSRTHLSAFAFAVDQTRALESIEISLFATDASLGILAANAVTEE